MAFWQLVGGVWKRTGRPNVNPSPVPSIPSAPTGLIVTTTSNTSAGLAWTASALPAGATPVTGYRVYLNNVAVATIGAFTTYSLTALTAGTTYSVTVSALNSIGESAKSPATSVTTTNTAGVPNAPSSLAGSVVSDTSVSLTWPAATVPTGAPAVSGYRVYRGATLAATLGNVLTATITGLTAGTGYVFYVVAVNSNGQGAASPTRSLTTTNSASATLTRLPMQPGAVYYGNLTGPTDSAYRQPGALVLTSRGNFGHPNMVAAAAAGAHVAGYFDALVWAVFGSGDVTGRLLNSSAYGPAVPKWPGPISANDTGDLADFRPGSVMHQPSAMNSSWTKLEAVLESIVAENPHLSGFFADDCGSRSYYPNFDWTTFGTQNQQDYRAGSILIAQAFRRVCNRNNMFLIVNGTWNGGTLASAGGGYPTMTTHGCSLADGGDWEHHSSPDSFSNAVFGSAQWGSESPITGAGKAFHLCQLQDTDSPTPWANTGVFAWAIQKSDYTQPALAPWGAFHPTGLPTSTSG